MTAKTAMGFEHVLFDMKHVPKIGTAGFWRRRGWKRNAFIYLATPSGFESFIAVRTDDGRIAPWTPSRCDLLEEDWERFV